MWIRKIWNPTGRQLKDDPRYSSQTDSTVKFDGYGVYSTTTFYSFYSVNPIANYDLKNDYTALVNLFDDETRKLLDGLFVSMLNLMN